MSPDWDALTDAVRRHWYTVALRSLQLEAVADPAGVAADGGSLGRETTTPNSYVYDHIPGDHWNHLNVWEHYSGCTASVEALKEARNG